MWKKIVNFEDYEISDLGEVKSLKFSEEKILKPQLSRNNGYLKIFLCKDGATYHKAIHKLVAQAFIPNPNGYSDVDHVNGNRQDNRVCNLRWCTHKDNMNYILCRKKMSESHKGKVLSDEHKSKISMSLKGREVPYSEKKINQYTIDGEFIRTWKSTMDIERELGFMHNNISAACKGKLNTAYGFKWKYYGVN